MTITAPRLSLPALLIAILLQTCPARAAGPKIFWVSDPVRPNETVLLQGSDLASAKVEIARETGNGWEWITVPALQANDQSLKFIVPAAWPMGTFNCRVTANGTTSETRWLNAPEPWWVQGDEGAAATPGGWMRVMGKSLSLTGHASAALVPANGKEIPLTPEKQDDYCLRFAVPKGLAPGSYTVKVNNGGPVVQSAGLFEIKPPLVIKQDVFSVLETYGPDAETKMRDTLIKYNQPADRTDGILAALKKAKDNGGGIVFFPAGRYLIHGPLVIPEHTILRGEGEGVVTLWWGQGHFNLDGGGPQGRIKVEEPKPPQTLIYGPDYEIEQMSLYLPVDYEQGIVAEQRFRMRHVRIRIDHYWLIQGRGNGVVARLGKNFQVTDCDILGKGDTLVPGKFGLIARNRVLSNKVNVPMGGSQNLIVEENDFVSMDPTTYQNISGIGRNIYYAHNKQEAFYAHQSDYSFTFDAGTGAYTGKIASDGTHVTLDSDPTYPNWAPENRDVWKHACMCILAGRGAGQWRDITSNKGRAWDIDRPFEVAPDESSVATIVSFNGRVLVIGNRFEDANWVNAGYGTSIDVVYAENELARCAQLMNYGLHGKEFCQPSWHVQFLDNRVTEGQTGIGSNGDGHKSNEFAGPLTCWTIHRRTIVDADNGGSISIGGNLKDLIVEGCKLANPRSVIKVDDNAEGVVVRNNSFSDAAPTHYQGNKLEHSIVAGSNVEPGNAKAVGAH